MARRIAVFLALLLLLSLGSAQAAYITAQDNAQFIKISTTRLITWVARSNANITVTNVAGVIQFQESRPFDFKVGTAYYPVTTVDSYSVSGDKVTVNCSTTNGTRKVKITLDYRSPSCFRASYEPSTGSTITQCRTSFATLPSEHFYGLGEPRAGTLDLRGTQGRIWIDKGHPEETNLVSFFLSTRGYGVWVDSYADGTFDFASTSTSTQIIWPGSKLSYYFFYGPEFPQIINQYTAMTGRPPMPPKWQFGLAKWLRPQGADEDAILADVQQMEDNDIPFSYTWIEPQWETQLNSLIFRTDIFPDPGGLIDLLHSKGYRVGVWIRTDIFEDSPNYSTAFNSGYFVMNASGQPWLNNNKDYDYYANTYVNRNRGFVDYTDTAGTAWWQNQVLNVIDYGIDGIKLDRGYEIDSVCKYQNGESGATAHNRYGYYMAKAHFECLTSRLGSDFFLMNKAEAAGSQSYVTLHWSGDQEGDFTAAGLPSAVIGAQSCGLSGFPFWTSDIGGWYTVPNKEVFARWVEFSAFTPAMETVTAPWGFDSETTGIFRYFTKLHYELIPYIYSLAYQANKTGEPIVRPLVYHYRTDQQAATKDYEFLLGRSMLVAPVCQAGISEMDVYLPKGTWINYWNNDEVVQGPATVRAAAPLNSIPVYVLAGAIIPLDVTDSEVGHGNSTWAGALTLDTFPSGDSSFQVYEDGKASTIQCSFVPGKLRFEVPAFSKRVIIRAKTHTVAPSVVKLNGSALTRYTSGSSFDSASIGWRWNLYNRLLIKYPANTTATIEVTW